MLNLRQIIYSLVCTLSLTALSIAEPPVTTSESKRGAFGSEELKQAIERGYEILLTGAKNYPTHRDCFSCHHQTLPLMALAIEGGSDDGNAFFGNAATPSKTESTGEVEVSTAKIPFSERTTTKAILDFMHGSFASKQNAMREGTGVGGGALTVAYGLWGMDVAGADRNETTDAMIEYLLKTQTEDGGWKFQSLRPPAASSRAMTTAIAIYGLRAYGPEAVETERLEQAYERADAWGAKIDEPESHEELIGLIWLDYMLSKEGFATKRTKLRKLRVAQLFSSQNEDGGWGQTGEMPSDAYATGQTLLLLAQLSREKGDYPYLPMVKMQKAIKYLLGSQHSDGSWHVVTRSKPVQVYFDNGDPHGKDQFISMMATAWATAALANELYVPKAPLESTRALERLRNIAHP